MNSIPKPQSKKSKCSETNKEQSATTPEEGNLRGKLTGFGITLSSNARERRQSNKLEKEVMNWFFLFNLLSYFSKF